MTSAMFRKGLTAAVALVAAGAVVAIAPPRSAEARPAGSPFAGTYQWNVGWYYVTSWNVTISEGGRITSSYTSASDNQVKGTLSGRVQDDGSYSFTVKQTIPDIDEGFGRGHGPKYISYSSTYTGSLAPDAGGNLVGTPDTGISFTWLRQ